MTTLLLFTGGSVLLGGGVILAVAVLSRGQRSTALAQRSRRSDQPSSRTHIGAVRL